MKKEYMTPRAETMLVRPMMMIAASDSMTSEMMEDVNYGGVDVDGDWIPSSRNDFTWGDEL